MISYDIRCVLESWKLVSPLRVIICRGCHHLSVMSQERFEEVKLFRFDHLKKHLTGNNNS